MIELLTGHCLDLLRDLPAESVHCAITSPPYYGLRDYGLPPSLWGDGWEGCLGLEPTVDMFVTHLVEVFRAVKRVLRPDGTCWLNLGDSYAGSWGNYGQRRGNQRPKNTVSFDRRGYDGYEITPPTVHGAGLPEKNLIGVPWRVAFALQADGWILRSDIVWSKGNPLPESVKDRPTKSHEYIFLLAKQAKYWYDAAAIQEPFSSDPAQYPARAKVTGRGRQPSRGASLSGPQQDSSGGFPTQATGRNKRTVWSVNLRPSKSGHRASFPPDLVRPMILAGCPPSGTVLDCFGGSGTVGLVAQQLGRDAVLLDLNPAYTAMASGRIGAAA